MKRNRFFIVFIVIAVILFTGCEKKQNEIAVIRVAEQYGLAYAPLTLIKELGLDQKYKNQVKVEWLKFGNTTAIREAMISNNLDIGFMGIPPFLIGKDAGMEWKIITGLSRSPLGLVAKGAESSTLEDIHEDDRIALPQPGSIQHILLAMAAEKKLGDAKKFDQQLVTLNHLDGMQAFLADSDITMHFTAPPFLFNELELGNHLVISGEEAFGEPFTFIIGTASDKVLHENKESVQIFLEMIDEALLFMEENPEQAYSILSEVYGMDADKLNVYFQNPDLVYERKILGLDRFVDFLYNQNYLKSKPLKNEIIWSEN